MKIIINCRRANKTKIQIIQETEFRSCQLIYRAPKSMNIKNVHTEHTALYTRLCKYLTVLLLITILLGDAFGNIDCVGFFGLAEMDANKQQRDVSLF